MATTLVLTLSTEETSDVLADLLQAPSTAPKAVALKAGDFVKRMAAGMNRGNMRVQIGTAAPVRASATATLATVLATQTITIGGVVFTASSTPSGEAQFEIDGDDTADAAALVVKINAHSTLSKIVVAESALGVVTITCLIPGVIGNFITLAKSDTTISLSSTALAGGTGGAMEAGSLFALGV